MDANDWNWNVPCLYTGSGGSIERMFGERMFGMFKIKGNAGFFVYICDSIGYLGSVGLLLYKEFFMAHVSWAKVMMKFSYLLTAVSIVLLIASIMFFNNKLNIKKPTDSNIKKLESILN